MRPTPSFPLRTLPRIAARLLFFAFAATLIGGATAALAQGAAPPERSTVLILDGSGSMWAELPEGRSRIEVARDVLGRYLASRNPAEPLGVVAYGHNRRGDCSDIEVVAPVGPQEARQLEPRLRALMPRGKTPLAQALRRAADALPRNAEEADLVLITDGLETCGGDPCAVARELAREGVPLRAHVVGFGLTEGEVKQMSCIAEATGGQLFSALSGEQLAEALRKTASPVTRQPQSPKAAALDIGLDTDDAGRPDTVTLTAENLDDGSSRSLGTLDFSRSWTLTAELDAGRWRLVADAGEQGNGSLEITVNSGEARTVLVPFTGALPALVFDEIGPYRAGAGALFPLEISREGLATGGADFLLTLLPPDATGLEDRAITWSSQDGSLGPRLGQLNLPTDPGTYQVAFHRYGETNLSKALALRPLRVEARPQVEIAAPAQVAPEAPVSIAVRGGGAPSDRVEIWTDGALADWAQSAYLSELFASEHGAARVLTAPAAPGPYEIVYLFADMDGDAAIATRLPLTVTGEITAEGLEGADTAPAASGSSAVPPSPGSAQRSDLPAPAGTGTAGTAQASLSGGDMDPTHGPDDVLPPDQVGYRCEETTQCVIEDPETGLLFLLPGGWITDRPTREAATAGGASGGAQGLVRMTLYGPGEAPDSIVLNPHQWIAANGPCMSVQSGQLCRFEPASEAMPLAFELVRRSIRDTRPKDLPTPAEALAKAMQELAAQDPAAAAAMKGLLEGAGGIRPGATPTGMDSTIVTCPETEDCLFSQDDPSVAGVLPAGWSVSLAPAAADGAPGLWFTHADPAGNAKRAGLNQPGGEACLASALGPVCEFTPYISTDEIELIAGSLTRGRASGAPVTAGQIDLLRQLTERKP
ncbi:vWA domain-containing protein [Roseibium aestuarii]|uniref:VWA domain-containing protein n=1 Tax=Roseibium aestuarii TaxID=2600299 RepID=A0ABW4JQB0_9HYPH|nr:VWA domain-containing protein [Roseibium aestuarii]